MKNKEIKTSTCTRIQGYDKHSWEAAVFPIVVVLNLKEHCDFIFLTMAHIS